MAPSAVPFKLSHVMKNYYVATEKSFKQRACIKEKCKRKLKPPSNTKFRLDKIKTERLNLSTAKEENKSYLKSSGK